MRSKSRHGTELRTEYTDFRVELNHPNPRQALGWYRGHPANINPKWEVIHRSWHWQLPTRVATENSSCTRTRLPAGTPFPVEPARVLSPPASYISLVEGVGMKFEDNNETQALLLRLKDYARDPGAASDSSREDLMQGALEYIFSFSSTSTSSPLHWFCNRAPGVVTECATFLLRLHAYENEQVPVWKSQCVKALHTCMQCCASYQDRKVASRKS